MPSIRILPPEAVNRIAAGEIVERPASVLKELIENSIDASATEVRVELEEGGKKLIRVRDNGSGIDPADLPLAFERHATSKLSDEHLAENLFGVATLGFRGEALASIAAVAMVEVVTRVHAAEHGMSYRPDGGGGPAPAAFSGTGLAIEARNLFYNVPARRKFLRTASTELARAIEEVTRLALGFPGIRFRLEHEKKVVFDLPPASGLEERLCQLLGKESAGALLEVPQGAGLPAISGFVGSPRIQRKDGRGQNFFVNGRWVRDRLLAHALRAAYQGFQIPGGQPVAYLFLELHPGDVDVNVHPAKAEVRFRDSSGVYALVRGCVRRVLEAGAGTSVRAAGHAAPEASSAAGHPPSAGGPAGGPLLSARGPAGGGAGPTDDALAAIRAAARDYLASDRGLRPAAFAASPRPSSSPPRRMEMDILPGALEGSPEPPPAFQVLDSFIIIEARDGIVIVDQHAFHEKIIFEEVFQRLEEGSMESQRLLVPEVLDLPREWMPLVEEASRALASFGFEVDVFGESAVAIRAFPGLFDRETGRTDLGEIVRSAIESFLDGGAPRAHAKPDGVRDEVRRLASLLACKRAVKAGTRLRQDEIRSLLARGGQAEDPRHCPHGRPAAVFLSRGDLERRFDRR